MLKNGQVLCDYCKQPAELVRKHKTHVGGNEMRAWFWECKPCEAWVKAHHNSPTKKPMGRLANYELRAARNAAYNAFNPLWQAMVDRVMRENGASLGKGVRGKAYQWLAEKMGIDPMECDFLYFDIDRCQQVVEICRQHTPTFMHKG